MSGKREAPPRRYEAPWRSFSRACTGSTEMTSSYSSAMRCRKRGRPVCVLVVTGPIIGLLFHKTTIFKSLGNLTHALDNDEARQLGRHLNRFLRYYGKERAEWQWDKFLRRTHRALTPYGISGILGNPIVLDPRSI